MSEGARRPEGAEAVELLEAQMAAISDTNDNLGGLIEKVSRIQAELQAAELADFAEAMDEPFTALSMATEKLQELHHTMEIERNRIRNEL